MLAMGHLAFAECSLNGKVIPCDQMPKWLAIFPVLMIPLFFFAIYFWIKMLIHVIKNGKENKTVWVLVIILLQFLGALIYYFVEKRPADKLLKATSTV